MRNETANNKHLMLFSGRAYPELAEEIAQTLETNLVPTRALAYANSEIYVRFEESVRGCDAFVIQSHTAPVNEWIMEQLIMVDAPETRLREADHRGGPLLPVRAPGQEAPRAGAHLGAAGRGPVPGRRRRPDHVGGPACFADPGILRRPRRPPLGSAGAERIHTRPLRRLTDVCRLPGRGRVRLADMWTDELGCPLAIIHKRRDHEKANTVAVHEVVGDVQGKTCLLVDDMIDTAGTITQAAHALHERGASKVICAATHAVFSGPAVERLNQSGMAEIIVTNTLPIRTAEPIHNLTVLSIAPLIARAINAVFRDGSVTSLFGGQA